VASFRRSSSNQFNTIWNSPKALFGGQARGASHEPDVLIHEASQAVGAVFNRRSVRPPG